MYTTEISSVFAHYLTQGKALKYYHPSIHNSSQFLHLFFCEELFYSCRAAEKGFPLPGALHRSLYGMGDWLWHFKILLASKGGWICLHCRERLKRCLLTQGIRVCPVKLCRICAGRPFELTESFNDIWSLCRIFSLWIISGKEYEAFWSPCRVYEFHYMRVLVPTERCVVFRNATEILKSIPRESIF